MTLNLWHELDPGPDAPEVIHVIVEIPKGSRNKYEYHKNYDDDDPFDVLVVTNLPTFTGCIVEARPIGMFQMKDRGEPDDKILAVLHYDPFFDDIADYTDLPAHYLKEVEHFFTVYKDLEGARVEPIGWENAAMAKDRIRYAINHYWDMRAGRLPKRI
jgi:inorganic pyrophosphatase